MARPKEFDRDVALAAAIKTFANSGYEGTSTDTLLKSMGISRQSLYDTFGDKRRLYLEALQRYCFDNVGTIATALQSGSSPLAAIEAALSSFAARISASTEAACLGVGAICEFGRSDREIAAIGDASGATLQNLFEEVVRRAKEIGEVSADVDPKEAALFLNATFIGLKVMARGGAKPEVLRSVAQTALRSLKQKPS
jgi:TetR/AcrR family transcriptional regulator, transcriptional repressor for nem operon